MSHKRAFVLSGGGNFGALQVGALRALLERQIVPDLIIGTSAGAINAGYFAARPTLQGVNELAAIWCRVRKEDVYPGTHWQMVWRMLRGRESLFPNQNFYRFVSSHIPADATTFRALHKPCLYITAAHLDTGELHLFGEDLDESVLDAIMASTALPPFSPPWRCADGCYYVDGGSVSDLPLLSAFRKGAREIYALHIQEVEAREAKLRERARTMTEIGHSAVRALLKYQFEYDVAFIRAQRNVKLHYLPLHCLPAVPFFDFSRSADLIESGYEQAVRYLDSVPQPATKSPPWSALSARAKELAAKVERAWKPKRYVVLSE